MAGQFNTTEFLQTISAQIGTLFQAQFNKIEHQLEQQGQRLDALSANVIQGTPRPLAAEVNNGDAGNNNRELIARIEELEQQLVATDLEQGRHRRGRPPRNGVDYTAGDQIGYSPVSGNSEPSGVLGLGEENHPLLPVRAVHRAAKGRDGHLRVL
ncbi:unnamed protein product [Linum trigynum]|uniref:Uncharacterized protein n=1 Tax=Linum trigynum TaxID=586398 RepID=A0AAV2GAA1_9ROSI